MNDNYYITQLERSLIKYTSKTNIISYDEIKAMFPYQNQIKLKKSISRLCRSGYLYRLKKGLYYSTPDKRLVINDPLGIPQLIYPGYIAFSTALRFYNLIEYEPFILYTVTGSRSRTINLGEYTFKYISMGDKATGAANKNGIWVSNIEKTFFDCFYKPQYAGGFNVITNALYEQKKLNWEILLKYINKFASDSLKHRIGYILDLMRTEVGLQIPKEMIDELQTLQTSFIWLLPTNPRRGKRIKKWKVFDNVTPTGILEWWYHS